MKNLALITGSYGGLGTCFVKLHGAAGGDMILVGRNASKLEAQAKEASAAYGVETHTIAVDLSKPEAAQTIYDACRANGWNPDVIINNAGFGGQGDFARERSIEQDMSMIADVASELGMSKRSLQRALAAENTTFQKQLNNTREILARHYAANTDMPARDIAYLLGYAEVNSLLRSFSNWTGKGLAEYRAGL